MKPMLFAAVLTLLPVCAQAQVAAGVVPDPFDQRTRTLPTAPTAPAGAERGAPLNARAETVLRTLISGAQAGGMDYDLMTQDLASKVREQESAVNPLVQSLGDLQSIEFVGSENGVDLFAVTFANGVTHWIIGFDEADKVAALLFRRA